MRQHPHIKPPILHLPTTAPVPIVLDSPHSGTRFPDYANRHRNRILRQDKQFFKRYADLYMDELIKDTTAQGATVITAPYARSWIDLNRQPDDILPEQQPNSLVVERDYSEEKLSLFWRRAGGCKLWDSLSRPEINRRLRWVWHAYHDTLREQMQNLRDTHRIAILLDCHSMPSFVSDYHVILGDDSGRSCHSGLVRCIYDFFSEQGLRVGLNDPFSGGSIIRRHGLRRENGERVEDRGEGEGAVQLELRRDLYMNEENFRKGSNFGVVRGLFGRLVGHLTDYLHGR